jgi:TonB family protein
MKTLYVCLLAAANCFAASIGGFVADASGGAIRGAQVAATNLDTQHQVTATSTDSGTYTLDGLSAGRYQVIVRAPGFAAALRMVTLDKVDSAKTLPVILDVGQISETMDVVGQGTASAKGPEKVRMGGSVTPARVLYMPRVPYPPSAKARGAEGSVIVRCIVRTDGSVGSGKAIYSPDPELEQAVIDALKLWRYEPARLNGEPVEVITTLTVNFQLKP